MSGAWNFSMSLNTFVVVVTGIALFVSVSTCYHVRQHSKEKTGGTYVPNNAGVPLLPVRTVPLLVMLVFQIGILFRFSLRYRHGFLIPNCSWLSVNTKSR